MQKPPEKGLYVSATDPEIRIVVERVDISEEDDFYLVSFVEEQDADDFGAIGQEYTPDEWESFVRSYKLQKA